MTFPYLLDNKCSQVSRLSDSPSFLFLASLFLVLMMATVCAPIAQAADNPETLKSASPSNPARQCNWINCFGDLSAMARQHHEILPSIQSTTMPVADARAFNENEFLPVAATANTANTPSAIFKTERWRTNRAVVASSIFEAAWLTADGITTAGMSRGASEVGSAWAYGRHPTPGRTAAMMAAEFVGVEASSYVLHKIKAPKWVYIAPMIVSGSLHASGAIPNMMIEQ
jgi:hypothetical protein